MPDKKLPEDFGDMEFDYWSPSDPTPSESGFLVSDGGNYENFNLISYLQRRVEKIVLFSNGVTPLYPATEWDVDNDLYTGSEVSSFLSAFFGVFPTYPNNVTERIADRASDYSRIHVFPTSDFPVLIKALQSAQAEGNGIIATLDLNTIENTW